MKKWRMGGCRTFKVAELGLGYAALKVVVPAAVDLRVERVGGHLLALLYVGPVLLCRRPTKQFVVRPK
jgi:hypothetical protein